MIILATYIFGFIIYWAYYSSFIKGCGLAIASAAVNQKSSRSYEEIFQLYKPNRLFTLIYLPLVFSLIMFFAIKKIYQLS